MFEIILQDLMKKATSVATDILGNRIKEKNQELLESEKKRKLDDKKAKEQDCRRLTNEQISRIVLTKEEVADIELKPSEKIDANFKMIQNETLKKISRHVDWVKEWSSEINFRDLKGTKRLKNVFVDLDTFLMPQRRHFSSDESSQTQPLQKAIFAEW